MSTNRLKKNITALFILQGANYLLPLITIPYLVRVLGPENFGRIAFAQSFITYFVVLTDYGFNLSATRTVAQVRDDKEALSRLASAVMLVKGGLTFAGFAVMLGIVFAFPDWRADWTLFAWVYLMVVGSFLFPIWLFQGLERMYHITVFTLLARLMIVIATFALVHEATDYHLAAGLQAGTLVLAGIMVWIALPRIVTIRWQWPGLAELRRVMAEGWHVFVASFAGNAANSSNIFFLGLVSSPAIVGYFAAAEKLIRAVQGLIYPVSQAAYPHVTGLLKISRDKALQFIAKLTWVFALGAAASSLGLFILADQITWLLYGDGFQETAELIRALSIIPFLIALNNILGAQVLVQFGLSRLLSTSTMIPTLLHIALLYFVAAEFGAMGVAMIIVFTETLMLAVRITGLAAQQPEILKKIVRG